MNWNEDIHSKLFISISYHLHIKYIQHKTKYTEFPHLQRVINIVHNLSLSYNQVYKWKYGFINY